MLFSSVHKQTYNQRSFGYPKGLFYCKYHINDCKVSIFFVKDVISDNDILGRQNCEI